MNVLGWFQKLFQHPPDRPGVPYTPRAAAVLNRAAELATQQKRVCPTTYDLTIALVECKLGCAAEVLKRFGVDSDAIQSSAGLRTTEHSLVTLLPIAQKEMRKMNHQYLGTEHLLLALLQNGSNQLRGVLTNKGITVGNVREAVIQWFDPNFNPDNSTDSASTRS